MRALSGRPDQVLDELRRWVEHVSRDRPALAESVWCECAPPQSDGWECTTCHRRVRADAAALAVRGGTR